MSETIKEEVKKAIAEKPPVVMNTTPQYDPAKQYTWDPKAVFSLTGAQFGLLLNTLRGAVSTKEAMQLRMTMDCNDVIEGLMAHGVGARTITEVPPQAPPINNK